MNTGNDYIIVYVSVSVLKHLHNCTRAAIQ